MRYLTNDKLVIVGAGGMIGSNMVQSALMLGLTPNICLYDIYEPGVHGVFDEIQQCAFPGANVTYYAPAVEDMGNPEKVAEAAKKAFTGAKYIISSGGAPRKAGMTREDLLKGNCKIAADFGDNIRKYCPDVEHVVVIFNPADVTALTTLIHSGLKPNQLTSLAALDSTRLQQALALEFGVQQDKVTGAHTYGGHGEQMAVFGSHVEIAGRKLTDIIGTAEFPAEEWEQMKIDVTKGGAKIIELRGRSSFQSPAYLSVEMIRAAMGGEPFRFPVGTYVKTDKYDHIMMAMKTTMTAEGAKFEVPQGTAEENAKLDQSYEHLCKMRDELVTLNIVPPISEWNKINPNL